MTSTGMPLCSLLGTLTAHTPHVLACTPETQPTHGTHPQGSAVQEEPTMISLAKATPTYAVGYPIPYVEIAGPVVKITPDTVIVKADRVNGRLTSRTYLPHLSGVLVHLPLTSEIEIYN